VCNTSTNYATVHVCVCTYSPIPRSCVHKRKKGERARNDNWFVTRKDEAMIKTPAKSSFRVKHIPSYFFISAATYISNNSCSAFGSTSFFTRISSKSMSQSSSTPTDGFSFTQWSPEARNVINENCIPPLTAESYKGSSGRVGVLGGKC